MIGNTVAIAQVALQVTQVQLEPLVGYVRNQERHDVGRRKYPAGQSAAPVDCFSKIPGQWFGLPDDFLDSGKVNIDVAMLTVEIERPRHEVEAMQVRGQVERHLLVNPPHARQQTAKQKSSARKWML